jgi:RimJ/RimL family protein N-acetyltransferase
MLRYRQIDPYSDTDIDLIVKWFSDRRIRHLAFRHRNEESYDNLIDRENVRQKVIEKSQKNYRQYIITYNGIPIGEMSLEIGAEPIRTQKVKTAWVGIVIGEASARGQGLGYRILKKIETIALEMGAIRIELGVFEFNKRAIRLYSNAGYSMCKKELNSTWWKGKMWSSVRMEKDLS